MTIETPAPLVEPRTTAGTGLTLPIAKALAHLVLVREATIREWPLERDARDTELREAFEHIRDIIAPSDLLTFELFGKFDDWKQIITAELHQLSNYHFDLDQLKNLITRTWQLLAFIDKEIAGIDNADPGSRP